MVVPFATLPLGLSVLTSDIDTFNLQLFNINTKKYIKYGTIDAAVLYIKWKEI